MSNAIIDQQLQDADAFWEGVQNNMVGMMADAFTKTFEAAMDYSHACASVQTYWLHEGFCALAEAQTGKEILWPAGTP